MAYTSVPTSTTGDLVTAAWFNTYIKDNFAYVYGKATVATAVLEPFSFAYDETVTTGDGKAYITIPAKYNGWVLSAVHARVKTAGSLTMQIHNVTDSMDMLSTPLTIDAGEYGSDTAAVPAVINTSNDDVASYDLLRIDVDAVSGAVGLIVQLEFEVD
jgi:hypothetical protein